MKACVYMSGEQYAAADNETCAPQLDGSPLEKELPLFQTQVVAGPGPFWLLAGLMLLLAAALERKGRKG